jgi:hypothetical protein
MENSLLQLAHNTVIVRIALQPGASRLSLISNESVLD